MSPIWPPLVLSLQIAACATALTALIAIPLAFWMARHRFAGRSVIEALITVPLVLPPTVVGYLIIVTLGARGAVYFTGRPVRSARVAAPADVSVPLDGGDPTGCGDVLGAAVVAGLLRGETLETALVRATRLAARNVSHRGASGLREHLLGRLSTV